VVPGKKIAFLVPDSRSPRYETQDRPVFQAKVQSMCLDCSVIYRNANGDSAAQRQQAESALAAGAKTYRARPVDGTAAPPSSSPPPNVMSCARTTTPQMSATSSDSTRPPSARCRRPPLLAAMKAPAKPTIVMLHGDPTRSRRECLEGGGPCALDGKVTIAKEFDTPRVELRRRQSEMTLALTALQNKVDGVYAANDEVAERGGPGDEAGSLKTLPPVTGDDAQLSAVQRSSRAIST